MYKELNGIAYDPNGGSGSQLGTPAQEARKWAWIHAWRALTPSQQASWSTFTRERKDALKKMTPAELTAAVA